MTQMCASRHNDFSAVDSGEKVPTCLTEATVPFLANASQGCFGANDLERFPVPLHRPQAPSWLFRDWISASHGEHQVLDSCA